jgi:hypothetical protein
MADQDGFSMDEWKDFVENFARFVDKWEEKKKILLQKLGLVYLRNVKLRIESDKHDDTSRLKDSFDIYVLDGEDAVEVSTDVEYALYLNDGHVQHKRFLPADRLSTGGRTKYLKDGSKGIMLKERYVNGVFYLEKSLNDSKPAFQSWVNSFMEQCAREVEGGRL